MPSISRTLPKSTSSSNAMDDIPFAFADSVLHCLNNESYSLTGSLHDRVWTAACSTHQTRRVNFELDIFFRDNGTFLCYLQRERSNDHIQTLSNEPYLSYIRIDTVAFSMDGPLQRKNDEMSFNEVLDIVIPLKPLLPAVRELHFVIGQPNGDYDGREQRKHLRKLDFLWKLQVPRLTYFLCPSDVLQWHLRKNLKLKETTGKLLPLLTTTKRPLVVKPLVSSITDIETFSSEWSRNPQPQDLLVIVRMTNFVKQIGQKWPICTNQKGQDSVVLKHPTSAALFTLETLQ